MFGRIVCLVVVISVGCVVVVPRSQVYLASRYREKAAELVEEALAELRYADDLQRSAQRSPDADHPVWVADHQRQLDIAGPVVTLVVFLLACCDFFVIFWYSYPDLERQHRDLIARRDGQAAEVAALNEQVLRLRAEWKSRQYPRWTPSSNRTTSDRGSSRRDKTVG